MAGDDPARGVFQLPWAWRQEGSRWNHVRPWRPAENQHPEVPSLLSSHHLINATWKCSKSTLFAPNSLERHRGRNARVVDDTYSSKRWLVRCVKQHLVGTCNTIDMSWQQWTAQLTSHNAHGPATSFCGDRGCQVRFYRLPADQTSQQHEG